MNLVCEQSVLRGEVQVPGSKSHTIRAVAIASLAEGQSRIEKPLESTDAEAAVRAYRALGARIDTESDVWAISGTGGALRAPGNVIDVANSGTTLRIAMGSCALLRNGTAVLTGDDQIRRRPCKPLAESLTDLGARTWSAPGNGCAPFVVQGRLSGGTTQIEAVTSQYVTSLLLSTPLADGDAIIRVPVLNERPYVDMTLDWLQRQGIAFEQSGGDGAALEFRVPGGQRYRPVNGPIPGDWSSATFFIAAGALAGNEIVLRGLEITDTQGDRAVLDYVRQMGAEVVVENDGVRVKAGDLVGAELDLNATPDALPALAVLGCFARGTTRLVNVPQARLKETDRIAVMRCELERLGANVQELPDGLVVEESRLSSAEVDGHGDHRVVMALAVAGTRIPGTTTIRGYEAVTVTYPGFVEALAGLGASARVV
jgi:3-phosphoshikimate 1-carboxyvinyltransferase